MDYDFYGLCDDQGEKFKKRLASLQKAFLKEYMFALNIINDSKANEMRQEIKSALDDALFTAMNKADVAFKECSHKIIGIMGQHL
jgi:hypothetical protein